MSASLEDILRAHQDLIHTVNHLTNAILQGPPKRLYQKMVVTLDLTGEGNKAIDLPFAPLYLGVVNESSVPVQVSEGRQAQATSGAATVDAGGQQAMFLAENTRTVTLSWSATPNTGAQTVILYVSNEPLPMFTSDVQLSSSVTLSTQLTGSNATIPMSEQGGLVYGPTHASLPATDFDTTNLVVQGMNGVWHRNARGRYVQVVNNLSVSIEVYLVPFDSLGGSGVPAGLTQGGSSQYTVSAGDAAQFGYSSTALMDSPVDSFYLGVTPAATGATGTLDVYYTEAM